jgi:hypothetical protein
MMGISRSLVNVRAVCIRGLCCALAVVNPEMGVSSPIETHNDSCSCIDAFDRHKFTRLESMLHTSIDPEAKFLLYLLAFGAKPVFVHPDPDALKLP